MLGAVRKLGRVFEKQALVEEAALLDDLLLDPRLLAAWTAQEGCVRLTDELDVVARIQASGALHEARIRVVAEYEAHPVGVPAVEVRGHGKVGVAAQQNVAVAGVATQRDGTVQRCWGSLVRRTAATAVDDEERLPGVGQRDQQRVVAPDALVRQIHPVLAFTSGRDNRTVRVDSGRLSAQVPSAALPHAEASRVD